MIVDGVSVTSFRCDDIAVAPGHARDAAVPESGILGLLAITTNDGVVGHSFLGGDGLGADFDGKTVIDTLKPVLMGQDPLDRERLHQDMRRRKDRTTWRAIGAVDIALWDIAGKKAGLPIHELIGASRTHIRACAVSSVFDGEPRAYVDEAQSLKEAGYAAYKINAPAEKAKCVAVCAAVRDAVGDRFALMLDPGGVWDYPDALRVGVAIADLNFTWYEDPLPGGDLYNYSKLKSKLHVPLMAADAAPGHLTGYAPWILAEATDFLRGDVSAKGGITSVIKAAQVAEGFHMNYELCPGTNALDSMANLHAAMAIRNSTFFDVPVPGGARRCAVTSPIEVGADGCLQAIAGPGTGAEIDFDLIGARTVETLS